MPTASSSDARPEEADPEPELPEDRHLEVETDEEFVGREEQLLRESMSLQHRLCHMPKNPYCETCRRSRMYKRRTVRTRLDSLSDRGALPEVKGFGERIASDFIIVAKSSDGTNESYVQVVRDEYSGYLFAYPSAFLGPYYHSTPMIMCKSENAREFNAACSTLGFIHEPTLAKRFPHNSVLERGIRTLEEIARAVHVGAGFHIYRDLWQHSVAYAAIVFNAYHPKKGCRGQITQSF